MSAIDPRLNGGRRQGPDRKLTPLGEQKLLDDYRRGVKLLQMQSIFGLSKKGIYDILKRHGVPTTLRKPPASESPSPCNGCVVPLEGEGFGLGVPSESPEKK